MEKISDNDIYLKRMRRTFADKMWFMSLMPDGVESVVDFGCADNSFLKEFDRMYPGYNCVGIDNNPEFLDMASNSGYKVCNSLDAVLKEGVDPAKSVLVMNSVLHEICSYDDPEKFWKDVGKMGFRYVALRDMYAKGCGCFTSRTEIELRTACLENNGNLNLYRKYCDYCGIWGKIDNGYDAVHFLLKYLYDENWERELRENYLSYSYRDLHWITRRNGYDAEFEQFYALPYLRGRWTEDFCGDRRNGLYSFINQVTTHFKMFLTKKEI